MDTNTALSITFLSSDGNRKISNVLTPDGKLMGNRIRGILKNCTVERADPEIGEMLLAKLLRLRGNLTAMQDVSRTTKTEVAHVLKRIARNEALYIALFKKLPADNYPYQPIGR